MTKSEMFVKAHTLTRETKKLFPEVNYSLQFGLHLSQIMKGGKNMDTKTELLKYFSEQNLKANLWEKNGKSRIYVQGFHYSKTFYVDLTNNTIKCNRPGAVSTARAIMEDFPVEFKIA